MKRSDEGVLEWGYFLDKGEADLIIISCLLSETGKRVVEFAVIYVSIIDGSPNEIIKYDVSRNEALHVHYYYQKPPKKVRLDREVSFETIEEIVNYVEKNWRRMKAKFMEP